MSLLKAQFVNHCSKILYSEKINKLGQGWPILKNGSIQFNLGAVGDQKLIGLIHSTRLFPQQSAINITMMT